MRSGVRTDGGNGLYGDPAFAAFQQAVGAYQRGQWADAERLCRQVLSFNAGFFDALHLLGVLCAQTGRPDEGEALLSRAVLVNPHHAEAHCNRGNLLRELGRWEDALQCFDAALKIDRRSALAHNLRGAVLMQLGRHEQALASFERAIKARPDWAEAHGNRGAALQAVGRPEEALKCFDRSIIISPENALAHYNRANLLRELGRNEEALASYEQALRLRPDYAEALNNRGNVLRDLARFDEALESYDRALQAMPTLADAHNNRAVILQRLSRLDEALQCLDRALQARPAFAEALNNRASVLHALGHDDEALASIDQALKLAPEFARAYASRAVILRDAGRRVEALVDFQRALELDPRGDFLFGDWLQAKMWLCDWSEFDESVADLAQRLCRGERAADPFMVMAAVGDARLQRCSAESYSRILGGDAAGVARRCAPVRRGEKIRIGYFSADFCEHATAHLIAGLIEKHDCDQFDVFGFSFGPERADGMRSRLSAAFGRFFDVRAKSDVEVADMSRELGVDIAVDLKGYTAGARPGIFAAGAAPVQIQFLGYPGTMGARFIDYLIADPVVISEASRCHFSEKIVYLPHTYQPNDRARPIDGRTPTRSELGLPDDAFVYCCFNNNYKINPRTFDAWMRMLRQVERGVLWLLEGDPAATTRLRKEAAARDVDPLRLVFAARQPLAQHLARHRAADLFLDTSPCNAHTTASDALWAGLPVLTLAGEAFASRVGASLLMAAGLPELITSSEAEYEAAAIRLAGEPGTLRALKSRLDLNRLTMPLFDTERFTAHLESAYREIVKRSAAGFSPEDIHITP